MEKPRSTPYLLFWYLFPLLILAYAFIASRAGSGQGRAEGGAASLLYALGALSAGAGALLGRILFHPPLQGTSPALDFIFRFFPPAAGGPSDFRSRHWTLFVIALALIEGAAVMGLAASFLGGGWTGFLLMAALSLSCHLAARPRLDAIEELRSRYEA